MNRTIILLVASLSPLFVACVAPPIGGNEGGGGGTSPTTSSSGSGVDPYGPTCRSYEDCPKAPACTYADCWKMDDSGERRCVYVAAPDTGECDRPGSELKGVCFYGTCVPKVSLPPGCVPPNPPGEVMPPACDDGDPCTVDSAADGVCYHAPVPDGIGCTVGVGDNGGAIPGSCQSGLCCGPVSSGQ